MHRKAVTPLFTPKSLKSSILPIQELADAFLVDFDGKLSESFFDISHDTTKFACEYVEKLTKTVEQKISEQKSH
jgi:cytochrome P450